MPVQSVNSFGLDVAMSFSLLAVSRHSNSNGKARKFYYKMKLPLDGKEKNAKIVAKSGGCIP